MAGERGKDSGGGRGRGKRLESIKSRGNRSRLSIKGCREADVRPHTDNSMECSMEFMRFNPLRNPREAALFSFPLLPHRATVYGGLRGSRMIPARQRQEKEGDGRGRKGGGGCTPETAGSKVCKRKKARRSLRLASWRKSEL